MRSTRAIRVLATLGLGLAALWAPTSANASCALPPGGQELWRTADAVFVGTVTAVENNARWAKVTIDEIWIGPEQPAEVVVQGGGADPGMMTSVDRTYQVGVRYLFAVMVVDGVLADNACSGTVEVDAIDLDAMRPADVRAPDGTPTSGEDGFDLGGLDLGGLAGPVVVVAVIGGLLLTTVLLARRRES